MQRTLAPIQAPIDNSPELEALLFQNNQHAETQENLLETVIVQNEKNSKEVKETIEKGDKEIVEAVEDLKPEIKKMTEPISAMAKFLEDMKGDKGYTPKKGVDYFTDEEIEAIKKEITPKKGKDYRDGEDGKTPKKGTDYFDGDPGKTPEKGVDYFTEEEIEAIKREVRPLKGIDYRDGKDADVDYDLVIQAVLRKMSKSKKGNEKPAITVEEIIKKIKEELNYSDIKGAPQWKPQSSQDTNLTELKDVNISSPTNGQVLIYNSTTGKWENGSGGGGTTINFADEETPSGDIDDVNVTFTLAHTPTTGSLKLYLGGVRLKKDADYTLSSATITMLSAPFTGAILLADYRY